MRTLFVIIGCLGLFLTGLAAFEITAARDYRSKLREMFSAVDEMRVAEAKAKGAVLTGTSFEGEVGPWMFDGIHTFERGWLAATIVGFALIFAGVRGVVIIQKESHD